MSKKNLSYLVIIVLLFILNLIMAGDGGKVLIGEPVTKGDSLSLLDLYNFPEPYLNKTVRLEGRIADICQDSRCSFLLESKDGGEILVRCVSCDYYLSSDDLGRKCITQGTIVKSAVYDKLNSVKVDGFGAGLDAIRLNSGKYVYYLESQGIVLE